MLIIIYFSSNNIRTSLLLLDISFSDMFEKIKTVWNGHPDSRTMYSILFENVSLKQLKQLIVKTTL